jgi:hypothetical protein
MQDCHNQVVVSFTVMVAFAAAAAAAANSSLSSVAQWLLLVPLPLTLCGWGMPERPAD